MNATASPNIIIKGATENNLKNVDLIIPRNKIVCFVGVSGSGKSTIAFDIVALEGQRQYFESLNSYARRYLAKNNRPKVAEIKGISSTVVISQDRIRANPRSTVGTVTEAYTYLRMLYSRCGLPSYDSSYFSFNHPLGSCPECKGLGRSVQVNIHKLLDMDKSLNEGAMRPSEWYVGGRMFSIIKATHYFDMDKKLRNFSPEELEKLLFAPPKLLEQNYEDVVNRWMFQGIVSRMMHRNTKVHRGPTERDLQYFDFVDCPVCHGGRLKASSLEVKLNGLNIGEVGNLPIIEALRFVDSIDHRYAEAVKPRLIEQLQFLIDAGVGYLSINRSTDTLSGGEAQRVKLARQLGCDLIETIYVLDEPTAGLHQRDTEVVIGNLKRLRDNGNTVLVVEHDPDIVMSADHIIEVGPGGGKFGGQIVSNGPINEFLASGTSLTSTYLKSGKRNEWLKPSTRQPLEFMRLEHASKHNLKDVTVDIPKGVLVSLTGVSGAGKSSLVEVLLEQYPEKAVLIGQSPIGTNKRGVIATYMGVFDEIRKLFARSSGQNQALFSFNSVGACPSCKGLGFVDIDMNFLGDIRLRCDKCDGKRYQDEVLQHTYQGKNINDVLVMTAVEAKDFFRRIDVKDRLQLLIDVGLDYVELGQTLDTLSGGEAQRLKLASKLQVKGEFYVLDEPTSGLHFADIEKLLRLLNGLVDNGNTVLVIEHNLDVICNSDWIIDLGPDGGDKGGEIIAQGPPAQIARCERSYTGRYIASAYAGMFDSSK